MVFFVVVACACSVSLGMVSLTLPGDSICCLSSNCCARDAWCTCHNGFLFLLCLQVLFFARFVVDPTFVTGDLGHELAQSVRGFPWSGLPGLWLHLLCLHCGNWCSCDNNCHHGMSIVVILTAPLLRLSARLPCGFKADCHGLPRCI